MKFIYKLALLSSIISLWSCQKSNEKTLSQAANNHYSLPRNWTVDVLFDEADYVLVNDSTSLLTKGKHDMIVYMPIKGSSAHGYLVVSHETISLDSVYGDGGGATIFEVQKQGLNWKVVSKKTTIDFSTVKQTALNCGGKLSPNGTILMAEEFAPKNTSELRGLDSTKYLPTDFGWIVEVNPKSKKAIRKLHGLGRYKHEDVYVMPDNKTIYISNDDTPAVLFKFIATSAGNYAEGQLYAYNQKDSINWIPLPMDKASLNNARDIAINKGATMFVRHEWLSLVDNQLYITETGNDDIFWKDYMKMGGVPASYFSIDKDSTSHDPFGRILQLDLKTDKLSIFKEGSTEFYNPDCLTNITIDSTQYLLVAEDIIGQDKGRSSEQKWGNGLWLFNLATKKGRLIMQAPKGSEITGLNVTPDQKTLFLNIQHPDKAIKELNGSTTLAISIHPEK